MLRREFAIPFLLVLLLPLTPSFAMKGSLSLVDYSWGNQKGSIVVHSGDGIVPLFVAFQVSVEENHTLRPLEAILTIPNPLKNPNGGNKETLLPGIQLAKESFKDGEGFLLTFNVEVPTKTLPNWYNFDLNVSYEILNKDGDVVKKGSNDFHFKLEVKGRSTIDFTLAGRGVKGESSTLYLTLKNMGKEDAIITSVQLSAPLIKILNPSISGGALLTPGSAVKYDIGAYVDENIDQDSDKVAVVVHYSSGGKEYSASKVFNIPLVEKNSKETSPSIIVLSGKHMLSAGISNDVDLIVKNVGDETAKRVRLQLSSKTLTVLGPSLFDLGDLNPGDSRNISLSLLPSEDSESYRLNLQFTYKEKEDSKDVTKEFTTEVGFGRIEEARVVISSLDASYSLGRLRIRGNLANVGNREADNVNVTIDSGACIGTSTYLGELDNGESTGFVLSCKVSPDELSQKIGVTVKYLASPENWKESRREVAVEGQTSMASNKSRQAALMNPEYGIIWALAGLIIGIILGKIAFGRRRSEEVEVP